MTQQHRFPPRSDRVGSARRRIASAGRALLGRDVERSPAPTFEPSLTTFEREILREVREFTMTTPERIIGAMDATKYIARQRVPGAIVECGVWRGGSVLAMIRALQSVGVDDREFYLYDTFTGMTKPADRDTSRFEEPALASWDAAKEAGAVPWGGLLQPPSFTLTRVREFVLSSGYPPERIHFVQGDVSATIPETAPVEVALLRLDTDWYDSTRHELRHLYPRLSRRGVLIIDDYGHWDGCRTATDEYFRDVGNAPLLARLDYSARLSIKP